ncbi:hypothetical protein [Nocardia wallacei]|uniref:hypothetical protein n=1 Tax=Nocardia wallacei TaxID=480035 RepID=UPI002457571F|nr:hypothetical protein [Nocardia wallacei]
MSVEVRTWWLVRLPDGSLSGYRGVPYVHGDRDEAEELRRDGIDEATRLGLGEEFAARAEIVTRHEVTVTLAGLGDDPTCGEVAEAVRAAVEAWALAAPDSLVHIGATGTESEQ